MKDLLFLDHHNQLFAIASWGCSATRWLAKALNSHPEILALHAGAHSTTIFPQLEKDSIRYFHTLSNLGHGYTAVGDVHGVMRYEIPKLKAAFGSRFNAVIVVREPMERIRSLLSLYKNYEGFNVYDFSYVDQLIELNNVLITSREAKLFALAVSMLNAILDEITFAKIYKVEEFTTNPDSLRRLVNEVTGGKVDICESWLKSCIEFKKINMHVREEAHFLLEDWQIEIICKIVSPEAWKLYADLGYKIPEFVTATEVQAVS